MVDNRSEADIQKDLLSWLHKSGYKAWKNYLGPMYIQGGKRARNPNSGQPDIFGISRLKPGRLFAIELKSLKGKLSDEQRKEIIELEKAGVYVIAGRNLDYVINTLGEWENGK